jgi:hypothetical protein
MNWEEEAKTFAKNADFYKGLLEQVAKHLGPEVFVSDDGSVQEDPLMLKIPELVGALKLMTITQTVGWAYGFACQAADNGQDIRQIEAPVVLEAAHKDLME